MRGAGASVPLCERLDAVGPAAGVLDVGRLWPGVRAWLLEPAGIPPRSDELVVLYVALCPPDPDDLGGRFLKAPEVLRDRETVGLRLNGRGAAVSWWFARTASWRAAETAEHGWIGAGPTTPSVDWPAYGDRSEWLVEVERSPEFRAALTNPPLAFELRADESCRRQWVLA